MFRIKAVDFEVLRKNLLHQLFCFVIVKALKVGNTQSKDDMVKTVSANFPF